MSKPSKATLDAKTEESLYNSYKELFMLEATQTCILESNKLKVDLILYITSLDLNYTDTNLLKIINRANKYVNNVINSEFYRLITRE